MHEECSSQYESNVTVSKYVSLTLNAQDLRAPPQ